MNQELKSSFFIWRTNKLNLFQKFPLHGFQLARRARAHRGARGGERRRAVHSTQKRALCARLSSRVHHCAQHRQARSPPARLRAPHVPKEVR
jgi:hypothetical protein